MIKGKRVLAIIPARRGSKRLPDKNIMKIGNRTLIEHALATAMGSKYIDHTLISTDYFGLKYPSVLISQRPDYLSDDDSRPVDVIRYILGNNEDYDIVVWLQPTSPLRISKDIDRSLSLLEEFRIDGIHSTVSVNEAGEHNGAVYTLDKDHISEIIDSSKSLSYVMPDDRSVDIDTFDDFNKAKRMMS